MHNEPLPPTPNFSQSEPSPPIFATSSFSLNQPKSHQTIVGPSDHYGIQHQYNNNGSGSNNNGNNNNNNLSKDDRNAKPSYSREETKVCIIVDSRTPVLIKIPLSPSQITLADLKFALPAIDQPNYKYFFKSNDSEFGIVKEEIQDDDGRLPFFRNRVVAWIVTPGQTGVELGPNTKSETDTCNLTYSNTSYDDGSSSLMTTDIESTSYFTETDDDSISCSDYSQTTCDTFISQRRNRHYSNGRSQTHHYHEHQNSSPYRYEAQHDRVKELHNKSPSSSTTSSTASQTDATAVHCLTVHLVLTNENFLGLQIYANAINGVDEGIYVEKVTENSAVALDGRIESGDKLIQVNEINLEELSNEEAVEVLKEAVVKRGPLKLVVAKFVEMRNEPIDGIVSPKEAIHPIDTAAWVAHAQAITNSQEQTNSATSSPSFGSNAQDTDCIRPMSAGIARVNSGLRLTDDLNDIMYHLKSPDIGLEIKDRDWLKIHIPNAFLGSDLITWLERNVYGFNSNREVKKFAAKMLKERFIRDPISPNKSFSSRSYYTLTTSRENTPLI